MEIDTQQEKGAGLIQGQRISSSCDEGCHWLWLMLSDLLRPISDTTPGQEGV